MSWRITRSSWASPPFLDAHQADAELRNFAVDRAQDLDARRTWDWESPGPPPAPPSEHGTTRHRGRERLDPASRADVDAILCALHAAGEPTAF